LVGCARPLLSRPKQLVAVVVLLALAGGGLYLGLAYLRAWHHLRAAREALARDHNPEATEHLKECLRFWPDDPEVLVLAARAARRRGDFADAEGYLNRPSLGSDAAAVLERILLRAARGEVDGVREYCETLISRKDPAAPLVFEALIGGFIQHFRIPEAYVYTRRWQDLQPDNTLALLFRGSLEEYLGNKPDAAEAYRRAVELDPELNAARLRLGQLLLEAGQAEAALPHLEQARRLGPSNRAVTTQLAACLVRLGRPAEAEKLFDEVLAAHPRDTTALFERGMLAVGAGRPKEAEGLLRQAAQPGEHKAHYQLYLCLQKLGKEAEANTVYERLKQIEKDQERIRKIVLEELPKTPHKAALHHELGTLLLRTGSVGQGVAALERILLEDPNHGPTHQALADFFEQSGQPERAVRHRNLAREAAQRAGAQPGGSQGKRPD
jgi:tetratricopeptide (TPR) repeat protein